MYVTATILQIYLGISLLRTIHTERINELHIIKRLKQSVITHNGVLITDNSTTNSKSYENGSVGAFVIEIHNDGLMKFDINNKLLEIGC